MPHRILSAGSAAAVLAALIFFAGEGAAQAARCPLGEIYRPSRGVCVTKEKAIQAGIYHGSSRGAVGAAVRTVEKPVAESRGSFKTASADSVESVRSSRAQALAAIERRAPVSRPKDDEALAFTTDSKPSPGTGTTLMQPKPVQVVPIVYTRPAPSPFGSLVALEPMP